MCDYSAQHTMAALALAVHTIRRLVTVDQATSKAIQITLKARVVIYNSCTTLYHFRFTKM